jgi:hypothetical protein
MAGAPMKKNKPPKAASANNNSAQAAKNALGALVLMN